MSVSPLSVSTFPIEGHLRRQAAARRQQEQVLHLAAECFGSGSPTAVDWLSAQGGARPSKWFGETGRAARGTTEATGSPVPRLGAVAPRGGARSGSLARTASDPFRPRSDYETWTSTGGTRDPGVSRSGGLGGAPYSPCTLFQAPADMSTGCQTCVEGTESCHRNIEGDDETCSDLAPCDTPFSRADFVNASSSGAEDRVNIDDAFTSDETDLLLKAWAILVQSTDLVKWAVCWITGNPGAGDCVVNHINGTGANVNIHAKTEEGSFNERGFSTLWGAGRINIFVLGYRWTNYVDIWRCGGTGGEVPVDKMCAAIDLSATLLHELTHACFRAWRDTDKEGKCYTSYLIENAYRWAIFHRYPDAASSACCTEVAAGTTFGNSGSKYPNTTCVSCSTSSVSTTSSGDSSALAGTKEWWIEHHGDKPGTWPGTRVSR